jgi:hypothetical protein
MTGTNWIDDKLNRRDESEFLTDYLLSKYRSDGDAQYFVLNVSAERGMGKSYFLKNWSRDLIQKGHPVVHFNAWENDFTGEPLLALLSELGVRLTQYVAKAPKARVLLDNAISSGKKLIRPSDPLLTTMLNSTFNGLTRDQLNKIMDLENRIKNPADKESKNEYRDMISTIMPAAVEQSLINHRNTKDGMVEFKENLQRLISHMDTEMKSLVMPMFIFVDELDQCRPEYTIELLEKIKHLFAMTGIYFVVATDSNQLTHSIKSVYGRNADTSRYVKQFFDQQYNLIEPNKYQYAEYLFCKYKLDQEARFFTPLSVKFTVTRNVHMDLFAIASKYFRLSLGEQDQICSKLKAVCLTWNSERKIHLLYILFLLMLQQRSAEIFSRYVAANSISERLAILKDGVYLALVDNSVIIKTSLHSSDGIHSPEEKEPFANIIARYVEYAGKSMPEIAESGNIKLKIYAAIRDNLIIGMPGQYDLEAPPRHELGKYLDIIRKVSHLIRR